MNVETQGERATPERARKVLDDLANYVQAESDIPSWDIEHIVDQTLELRWMVDDLVSRDTYRKALACGFGLASLGRFCDVLAWEPDEYAIDKFADLQQIGRLLARFSPGTLRALLADYERRYPNG